MESRCLAFYGRQEKLKINGFDDLKSASLFILLFFDQRTEHAVENGKNETEAQRPPKTIYTKAIHKFASQKNDYRVNY